MGAAFAIANWTVYPSWVAKVYNRSTTMYDDGCQPPATASLQYRNDDPTHYQTVTQIVRGAKAGTRYILRATIRSALNTSVSAGAATVAAEWDNANGKFGGGFYPPGVGGSHNWLSAGGEFVLPPEADPATLKVTVYVRPKGGTGPTPTGSAWWDGVHLMPADTSADAVALRAVLLRPVYRGWITSADAHVVVRAHILANGATGRVAVAATIASANKKELVSSCKAGPFNLGQLTDRQLSNGVDLEFPDMPDARKALQPGRQYTLQVDLFNVSSLPWPAAQSSHCHHSRKCGSVIASQQFNLMRLDDSKPPPAVYIDHMQRTIVNGTPFFPFGFYYNGFPSATALSNLSTSPFNALMPYGETSSAEMDAAHAAGLRVAFSLKDIFFGSSNCPSAIKSLADEEAYFRQRVAAFRGHPALLSWYINDEMGADFRQRLQAHQRWLVESDTGHPSWEVEDAQSLEELGWPTFDIAGTDPYPIGESSARGPAAAAGVHVALNSTRLVTDGARPLWVVVQAMNWLVYERPCRGPTPESCHTPTKAEFRSMAWQAVAGDYTHLHYYYLIVFHGL